MKQSLSPLTTASSSAALPNSPVPVIGSFEGLRGISAVLVVIYHFRMISGDLILSSYLFVDVFFVMSGYIMMLNYGDQVASGASGLDFLGKRIARLYPLFLFTTATALAAHGVAPLVAKLVNVVGLAGDPRFPAYAEIAPPGRVGITLPRSSPGLHSRAVWANLTGFS